VGATAVDTETQRTILNVAAVEDHVRGARGHFWNLIGGEAANKLLRFVAAIVLARFLAPSTFGIFNVGIAISGVLVTASALGLPEIGSRTVAARRSAAQTLVGPVIVGRLAALAVGSAGFVVVALVAWPDHTSFYLATIAVAVAMTLTPDWLARGLERMRVVRLATTLGGVVTCVGAAAVARTGSAELALVAFAAGEATVGLVCWRGIASMVRPISTNLSELPSLVKMSWPLGVASVVTYSYYANVDTIILASFRSAHEAGIYSAAYRVFLTFNVVPIFAAYATFPILSRLAAAHADAEARTTISSVLAQLACYGACVVGFVELGGRLTLHALFGPAFVGATPTFTLLAVAAAWYAVGYGAGYSLIATGNMRGFVAGAVIAGVLNLGLDLVLIPPFGMVGAGVATAVAFAGATTIWLHQRQLHRSQVVDLFAGLVAVSGGAGVILIAPRWTIGIGLATLTSGLVSLVVAIRRHPGVPGEA
jgi:O-antigen/teichoic acid export membrane protein